MLYIREWPENSKKYLQWQTIKVIEYTSKIMSPFLAKEDNFYRQEIAALVLKSFPNWGYS